MNEVKKGTFRQDLFYRLFGLPIDLPPLRERGKDILLLARHFIDNFCSDNGIPVKQLTSETIDRLMSYPWPGNVRELKSVIDLAVIMSPGDVLRASDLIFSHNDVVNDLISEEMTMKLYNRKILDFYLNKYQQNIPLVAQKLGISQATIYRMLKNK